MLRKRRQRRRVHQRVQLQAKQDLATGVATELEALVELLRHDSAIGAKHRVERRLVHVLPDLLFPRTADEVELGRFVDVVAALGEEEDRAWVDARALLHEHHRLVRGQKHTLQLVGLLPFLPLEAALCERKLFAACLVRSHLLRVTLSVTAAVWLSLLLARSLIARPLVRAILDDLDVGRLFPAQTVLVARETDLDVFLENTRFLRAAEDARPARSIGALGRLDAVAWHAARSLRLLQRLVRNAARVERARLSAEALDEALGGQVGALLATTHAEGMHIGALEVMGPARPRRRAQDLGALQIVRCPVLRPQAHRLHRVQPPLRKLLLLPRRNDSPRVG
eukprot:5676257-Prymnesium_polylepis.1